jgi:hypothetical protein
MLFGLLLRAPRSRGAVLSVVAASIGGLEVAVEEGVEEVERQHSHQAEDQGGGGMVFVDVVGGPAVSCLVEALILDVPAGIAEGDDRQYAG